MKTVGEILSKARVEKQLTLKEVSQGTKIQLKYLKAIEDNNFGVLPPLAFTKGFIRNFSLAVGLNPINVLAIFRRDFAQDEHGKIIPRALAQPIKTPVNIFNPKTTTLILTLVMGVLILGFFVRQAVVFSSAPALSITQPQNQETVTSPVTVMGTTDPQARVTVNNRPVVVEDTGNFSAQMPLTLGEHTLVVTATSRSDKARSEQRIVTVSE
jgi:cytoskeletal protein RodZ